MTFAARLAELDEAVRARLRPFAHQARAAWQQRTSREQNFLRVGALLVVAVLVWVLALSPALQTVQTARQQLPLLQAQSARLGAVILEAQALTQSRSGVIPVADTEPALLSSLRSAGLDTVSTLSRPVGVAAKEMQWQVQFANAPAGRIMEWMSNLPFVAQLQTLRVDLARSTLDGRDRPGQLDGVIVLTLIRQQGKSP